MNRSAGAVAVANDGNLGQVQGLAAHGLRDLVVYFAKLGTFDFGGPIALAELAPGPLAAQLAIYIACVVGLVLHQTLGGTP